MKISGIIVSDVGHMGMVQFQSDATPPHATHTFVKSGLRLGLTRSPFRSPLLLVLYCGCISSSYMTNGHWFSIYVIHSSGILAVPRQRPGTLAIPATPTQPLLPNLSAPISVVPGWKTMPSTTGRRGANPADDQT